MLDAILVSDFRPISLIGCVYKVVTKIMANRLEMFISDILSNTQSAFIFDRQILDGPFIKNEISHWCKRKNKHAFFFKVDFEKAYDSIRWDYLIDVLSLRPRSWLLGVRLTNSPFIVGLNKVILWLLSCLFL